MRLIREEVNEVEIICENTGDRKKVFIEGVFLQGNVVNRNKRFYPVHILERAVDAYDKNFIRTGRAVGELSHGNTPQIQESHRPTSPGRSQVASRTDYQG